jgi:hypothetical protein
MMLGSFTAVSPSAVLRSDSRALSAAERATFLRLVCRSHYMVRGLTHCIGRIGYTVVSRPEDDISLIAVIYGGLTRAGAREAYVTYESQWEPHSMNFGGGILFEAAPGGWRFVRWYPGGQMDHCLALPRSGRERFLCRSEYAAMGMFGASVFLRHAPPAAADPRIFRADDSRSVFGNPLCSNDGPRSGGDSELGVSALRRSSAGAFAEATVTYATPDDILAACDKNDLPHLRTKTRLVRFVISGTGLKAVE